MSGHKRSTEHLLDITDVDIRKFIAGVYNVSRPVGMGIIHYTKGDMPEELIDEVLKVGGRMSDMFVDMDYVLGRQCKMTVFKVDDRLYINPEWFDHSLDEFFILMKSLGYDTQKIVDLRRKIFEETGNEYYSYDGKDLVA